MKRRPYGLICCTICLLAAILVSCRSHGILSDDFKAGDTVTPEELLEISREIFTETAEPTAATAGEPITLAPDVTVYWLDGGSVYHADRACRHIAHAESEDIREGKTADAVASGKSRLCASCTPKKG